MADGPQVFALRLNELIEKAKAAPREVVRKVGLDIADNLIERSPVDTGRFKANWNVAFGYIDPLTTPSTDTGRLSMLSPHLRSTDSISTQNTIRAPKAMKAQV